MKKIMLIVVTMISVFTFIVTAEYSLLERGIELFDNEEYLKAEKIFETVLNENPYNRDAMYYLQKSASMISAMSEVEQKSFRAQALADVEQSWKPDPKVLDIDVEEKADVELSPEEIVTENLIKSMKSIRIDKCDFQNEEVSVVLSYLAYQTREKSGKSVNFVPYGMSDMTGEPLVNIELFEPSIYEALTFITEMNNWKFEVRSNAVIVMPIDYVAQEDLKVVTYHIMPEVGSDLEEAGGNSSSTDDLFADISPSDSSGGPIDVQSHFAIVDWPTGSKVLYHPNHSRLQVKNTQKNINTLELVLNDMEEDAIKKRTRQVEIETKFVEYNEGALEELGYDWSLYDSGSIGDFSLAQGNTYYTRGGTYPASPSIVGPNNQTILGAGVSGVREVVQSSVDGGGLVGQSLFGTSLRDNTAGFESFPLETGILSLMGGTPATLVLQNYNDIPLDLAISAMEQEGSADVLSAPKVTTKSGNRATIRITEEHRYPRDYDVETGQRTAPVVKPQDWEDVGLGVELEVEPTVDVDNNTIELELKPSIKKFVGYDQYKVGNNSYESGGNNQSQIFGDGSDLIALMPYFKVRSIETAVLISDGSTVVMGGLVDEQTETFRDQVPLLGDIPYLGRWFRSEGSRNMKKNLLITVKATQVDDRGMTKAERELEKLKNGK